MNKAVFLDRDGTIAEDVNYCRKPEDFRIFPWAPEAIRMLNGAGFKVIVITNQSGIARGYFTEEMLAQIHEKMLKELAEQGARIDGVYYCPHHPDDNCECRKPKTALFQQAAKDFNLDLKTSWVVGDSWRDIEAGRRIGTKTILVKSGPSRGNEDCDPPDFIAENLLEAAKRIIGARDSGLEIGERRTLNVEL